MTSNRDFSPLYLSKILAMFDGGEKFAAIPLMVKDSASFDLLSYVRRDRAQEMCCHYWASCQE